MMYLNGMVFVNRNLNQHYKSVNGYCKGDFNATRINNYIIPRATLHYDFNLIWGYELSKLFYLTPSENENSTECAVCEFEEDCNGQLCMFAMI